MDSQSLRDSIGDAIRFWEPRRVLYNAILAMIVVVYFWIGLPSSKQNLNVDFVLGLFLLAVVANVAYCAAYLVDVFVQMSAFRGTWRNVRWIVFGIGTVFAAIITRFIAMGMFAQH
jgi:hypothetical protein